MVVSTYLFAIYDGAFATVCNLNSNQKEALQEALRFKDQSIQFQNKQKHSPIYREDPTVDLFDIKASKFPTGLLPRVQMLLKHQFKSPIEEISKTINDTLTNEIDLEKIEPFSGKFLWEHQKLAITTALQGKRCIIESPTGSGKSTCIAILVKHFPKTEKVVITAPTAEIAKSNADEISYFLGEEVGLVGGSNKKYKRVTSMTTKSVYLKLQEDPRAFEDISILIFDECHTIGHNEMSRVINKGFPNTDYRVGFSGTAWREARDNLAMEGYIGPVLFRETPENLQKKGILVYFNYLAIQIPDDPTIRYPKFNTKTGEYKTINRKPERQDVYQKMIIDNKQRNQCIVNLIKEYNQASLPYGSALVLAESVDQSYHLYEEMTAFLEPEVEIEYVKGGGGKKRKQNIIDRLKNKELKVVVSTKVFNVGVNFPPVGLLVIGGGGNATSNLIQKIGRIVRKSEGKDKALVVDFEDFERFYLHRNFYNRTSALKTQYPSTKVEKVKGVNEIVKHYFKT
jgi:superfamily II DNA or RNA helicase